MSRRRNHRGGHDEEHENSERWLLTYADMITLLLALFIVLFAISTINQKKFLALALGLKQSFDPKPGILPNSNGLLQNASLTQTAGEKVTPLYPGALASTTTSSTSTSSSSQAGQVSQTQLSNLSAKLAAAFASKGLQSYVSLQQTSRGLVVQILADKVFFTSGSADVGPVGGQVIDAVASVLKQNTFALNVEGYTDNQPITGGPYSSNEELSAVRAVNVELRLKNSGGINPNRLSATGYGDTHPVAPNDSAAHMAQNRRIDIVVLSNTLDQP